MLSDTMLVRIAFIIAAFGVSHGASPMETMPGAKDPPTFAESYEVIPLVTIFMVLSQDM
jgi:hypothetical protein